MSAIERRVYVISDLHLGGDYPKPDERGKRGFRLCTHVDDLVHFVDALAQAVAGDASIELILNGDTVDFLAERDIDSDSWSSFTGDQDEAVAKFNTIVERDPQVFDSLHNFLECGGRLTILLGNHDIELSLPSVRAALRRAVGVRPGHDFEFIYDGEAYIVGDALIEHGNRYDAWNQVDFDALRRFRSLLSRRQAVPEEYKFDPPAGSKMVTSVINPIKLEYPFVDLLKPEEEVVAPMLLALEPGFRWLIAKIAKLLYSTRDHGLEKANLPAWGGDVHAKIARNTPKFGGNMVAAKPSTAGQRSFSDYDALREVLQNALHEHADGLLREIEPSGANAHVAPAFGAEIGAKEAIDRARGIARLITSRDSASLERRLPALLKAIRCIQGQDTFVPEIETAAEYLKAARELATRGFRYVVFGHTHKPKQVSLGTGRYYLNSGAWADILRFPIEILTLPEAQALSQLYPFVKAIEVGDFSQWTTFYPTYVRLELDESNTVARAELRTFSKGTPP
jgi:UDP-2,3-diacylglucosamine pyrophosphatase LpxH